MAPKGRWGKKDAKVEPKAERVLPVRKTKHDMPDAICVQLENWFTISECETYLEFLLNQIKWNRQEITVTKLDGRVIEASEPRLTSFMADEGICYEYSRRDNVGTAWHPTILKIKEKTEQAIVECGLPEVKFNAAFMNRYDGPRQSLGMHSDNEPDLVRGAPIASCSFGATREFRIMRRDDESQKWSLNMADGCFIVMAGEMQRHYLHSVPPGGDAGTRINITFRCIHPRQSLAALSEMQANAEMAAPSVPAAAAGVSAAPRGQGFRGYRSHAVPPQAVPAEAGAELVAGKSDWRRGQAPERSERSPWPRSDDNEPRTGWD